ncbi:MAG: hypothetical protein ACLQVJ_15220, partial [Syntrophobacteraceae bacterium]
GCSPPRLAATQFPLTTGSEHLPGGDFHPSDRARFQAHGFRPKRAAGMTKVGAPPLFIVSGCPEET